MRRVATRGGGLARLTAIAVLFAGAVAGCAAPARVPECHGRWVPINAHAEDRRRG